MTNQKTLISVVFGIILLLIGFLVYKAQSHRSYNQSADQVAPDVIPEPVDEITNGYVGGHITIGPNCPGPVRQGEPCEVPPEAYSSRMVMVYQSDGTTLKEKDKINAEGNYKISLSAGNYFIQISPAGIRPGEKKPATVKSGATTVVNFDIDTGIR